MAVHLPNIADILDEYDDDDEIPDEIASFLLGDTATSAYAPSPPIAFAELRQPWMYEDDLAAWSTFAEEFA